VFFPGVVAQITAAHGLEIQACNGLEAEGVEESKDAAGEKEGIQEEEEE
jgi:hypothetical protein